MWKTAAKNVFAAAERLRTQGGISAACYEDCGVLGQRCYLKFEKCLKQCKHFLTKKSL